MRSLLVGVAVATCLISCMTPSSAGQPRSDSQLAADYRSQEFKALDTALQGYIEYLQTLGHRGRPPIAAGDEAIVLSRFGLPMGYQPQLSNGLAVVLDGSPGSRGPLHAFVVSDNPDLRFSPYSFHMSLIDIDFHEARVALNYSTSVRASTAHGTVCRLVWVENGWSVATWGGWAC